MNWPARMQKLDKGKLSKFTGNSFEIWLDGDILKLQVLFKRLLKFGTEKIFL